VIEFQILSGILLEGNKKIIKISIAGSIFKPSVKWLANLYYYYYLFLTAIGLTPGGSSTVHIWLTPGGSSTVHRIQRTEHT
jgi:hypothetical protein